MSALDGLRNVALDLVTRLADKSESGVELTLEDWRTLAILVCDAVFDEFGLGSRSRARAGIT